MGDPLRILEGDCISQMRLLPAESVHCIITSPPYWGLRDYKIPPSIWGGKEKCRHVWGSDIKTDRRGFHTKSSTLQGSQPPDARHSTRGHHCAKCGAWQGTFGLEPSAGLYVEHSVLIFREAWRVLRKDGTLWLNLGDTFAPTGGDRRDHGNGFNSIVGRTADAAMPRSGRIEQQRHFKAAGLKGGDLVGIPWRIALALQADGWYLRRDNIWYKRNPMPESVSGWQWEKHRIKTKVGQTKDLHPSRLGGQDKSRSHVFGTHNGMKAFEHAAEYIDCPGCVKCEPNGGLILKRGNWRCTTSHEYVFQFSKSSSYFCDAQAAREKTSGNAHHRGSGVNPKAKLSGRGSRMNKDHDPSHQTPGRIKSKQNRSFSAAVNSLVTNRNMRSVWNIPTKPYRGAHFATFPPDLVRPIVRAGSPSRCCSKCGGPFAPIVERGEPLRAQQRACGSDLNGAYLGQATKAFELHGAQNASDVKARILAGMVEKRVVGYRQTCQCVDAGEAKAVVLDIFAGSGTVGQVSIEEGREVILIEISTQYVPMIRQRCEVTVPLGL